jgi:tRNA (cmo5U34)-methyltransferase
MSKLTVHREDGETRDAVFAEPKDRVGDFKFDQTVAKVFDDMVSRSVPFYDEIQRMSCELAAAFAQPGTAVYDIGCATATTLARLDPLLDPKVRMVGIDNAEEMLVKARQKMQAANPGRAVDFQCLDVDRDLRVKDASVVNLILTLQFVRPLNRERVVRTVYDGLVPKGCLILVEKLVSEHTLFNRLFIENYYDYKRRNGYSDVEIAQKREALENVLVPYRLEENLELLRLVGFRQIEVFFRWYNFCGIIAMKD